MPARDGCGSGQLARLHGNAASVAADLLVIATHESASMASESPDGGIVFEAVTLVRGGQRIFDELSLTLHERRIGLIGENGSGKSTLLRLMNGLLLPDSGRILANGRDTARSRKAVLADTGFVFQNPDHQILFPTVGEEIAFGLSERGLDRRGAREQARTLLEQHRCRGWDGWAVHELSEGQKQLVCILAAIAAEPRTVLLDEPFASLDLPTRLALGARLRALPQRIVMASHDLDLLADFDRIIWLQNGRVRGDGIPDAVLAAYRAHARKRSVEPADLPV
jgi:biotin transport system ATP-binding protein